MDVRQLRCLQLADLGESELRELIAAGETVADRKAGPPDGGMGPTIAAFATVAGYYSGCATTARLQGFVCRAGQRRRTGGRDRTES